ncbi:hypothetical protein KI387_031977 [Taxus chinensis]|uniref:NB-ARC domain-containing protein n=1 Tax=Taxus chinensis TaxID=29808 RepID=A0AA38F2Q5_TAXCH|nr:hypothetical protein KI387_031977 [Taxus chinensis]
MDGTGKTFLLQNVFNRIKERFEYSIWLSISQTYSLQRLQADLVAKINLGDVVNGRISEVHAAEFIHSWLESKKSLIVLDDVWRATGEDNLIRTLGLPIGNNMQCKIVVTMRNKNVCRSMNARVYEMQFLSEEESWELFCAFSFSDCEQKRPTRELEKIASEIEEKCKRLPLAVKIVAASLTGKTSSRDCESKFSEIREEEMNWFRMALDEAHTIKSSNCSSFQAISALVSDCRWGFTGTPLQVALYRQTYIIGERRLLLYLEEAYQFNFSVMHTFHSEQDRPAHAQIIHITPNETKLERK